MNRLTERLDLGLDEWEQIAFKTPDDEQGLYNIVDVVEHRDEEWARQILLSLAETVADYEDTGLTPEQIREMKEKAIMPPCNIGDVIYVIPSEVNYKLNILHSHEENNRVYEQMVCDIRIFSNNRYSLSTCDGMCSVAGAFYKETWFLSKEEAESKLAEMEGGYETN